MSVVSRLEVIQTGARRRWTVEEKRRIVAESYDGRRQASATARRYGLTTGQLFTWRRLAQEGRLGGEQTTTFAQAVIACDPAIASPPSVPAAGRVRSGSSVPTVEGRMEIVLSDGRRVIVDKDVDAEALLRVIGVLVGR